ncbi:MAG: NADH-quinone oxidoreductase subunit J [Solitalea-like symbiont of Acarus siro]
MLDILFYLNVSISFILTIYILLNRNTLNLLVTFFLLTINIALTYLIIGSGFIGITYLIIYLSATIILIVANFMHGGNIIAKEPSKGTEKNYLQEAIAIIIALIFFITASITSTSIIYNKFKNTNNTFNEIKIETIGIALMTNYIIPFEVISIILLASLVGIIIKLK